MASASSGAPAAADATALLLSDFVPVTINGTATSVDALALPWFERKNGGRGTLVQLRPILELGEPALTKDGPRRNLLNKLGVVRFVEQSVFGRAGAGAMPPIVKIRVRGVLGRNPAGGNAPTPFVFLDGAATVLFYMVESKLEAAALSAALHDAVAASRGTPPEGGTDSRPNARDV